MAHEHTHREPPVESETGRRALHVLLTPPQYARLGASSRLAQVLGCPPGAWVTTVVQRPLLGDVVAIVLCPAYDEVPWRAEPPAYQPGAPELAGPQPGG